MARRASTSEKLTDANLQRVISLLAGEKPITKKAACEILGITYNTTRLQTLIDEYKAKMESRRIQRDKKKGTSATKQEMQSIVVDYLKESRSITEIAEGLFRSANFVKNVLDRCGVPIRSSEHDYHHPPLIPDSSICEDYMVGDVVYAVRYSSLATVRGEFVDGKGQKVYRIWLEDEQWQQFAYQPYWELMSLRHITDTLGVKL